MICAYSFHHGPSKMAIIHLGLGLIGQEVQRLVGSRIARVKINSASFPWHDVVQQQETIRQLFTFLQDADICTVLWTAGKMGFSGSEEDAQVEFETFTRIIETISDICRINLGTRLRVVFVSSAGGLYEGRKCTDANTKPRPLRPYGHLKLRQEQWLMERDPGAYFIVRPSTVYSTRYKIGQRLGLISVLVQNALKSKVTNIFGSQHTLRDYVSTDVLSEYLLHVCEQGEWLESDRTRFAVSGKPTSINELVRHIELEMGHPVFVKFSLDRLNSADITFHPALRPKTMRYSDVKQDISLMLRRMTY